jgi:uncharacterized membrane protein
MKLPDAVAACGEQPDGEGAGHRHPGGHGRPDHEPAEWMDHVAQGFEVLGAVILVAGVVWSVILAMMAAHRSRSAARAYLVVRQAFGGTLLLGLEVLVAADLVRTVAVAPTLDNVLVLGLIVVIRTFLSFSPEAGQNHGS